MHCFIDFDDVLFDRQRFTADLFDEPTRELYREYRLGAPFTVRGFCQFVQERGGDGHALQQDLLAHAQRSADYVFPDAADFLRTLRQHGHHVAILSFDAEPETWQLVKIKHSGLVPLCDSLHVTRASKAEVVASLHLTAPFFFLDDKATEIRAMQAAFPEATCLQHVPGSALCLPD